MNGSNIMYVVSRLCIISIVVIYRTQLVFSIYQ